jgi:hypothetical protein
MPIWATFFIKEIRKRKSKSVPVPVGPTVQKRWPTSCYLDRLLCRERTRPEGVVPTSLPSVVVFLQLIYGGRHYLAWSKPYLLRLAFQGVAERLSCAKAQCPLSFSCSLYSREDLPYRYRYQVDL